VAVVALAMGSSSGNAISINIGAGLKPALDTTDSHRSTLGELEEIARAVVFLVANDAGAIISSTLSINGGQYMV